MPRGLQLGSSKCVQRLIRQHPLVQRWAKVLEIVPVDGYCTPMPTSTIMERLKANDSSVSLRQLQRDLRQLRDSGCIKYGGMAVRVGVNV